MSSRDKRPEDASYEVIDECCVAMMKIILDKKMIDHTVIIGELDRLNALVFILRELHKNTTEKYHAAVPVGLLGG